MYSGEVSALHWKRATLVESTYLASIEIVFHRYLVIPQTWTPSDQPKPMSEAYQDAHRLGVSSAALLDHTPNRVYAEFNALET